MMGLNARNRLPHARRAHPWHGRQQLRLVSPAPPLANKKDAASVRAPPSAATQKTHFWNNVNATMLQQRRAIGMSLSDLANNASFACATAAFLNADIMSLRILAMSGISLSVISQYYRPDPLWIPIRWNFVLFGINAAMVTTLYLERKRAERMDPEMEHLYEFGLFEKRGFSRVEFCRLFEIGRKRNLKEGEVLTHDGQLNTTLYFLMDGRVAIKRAGRAKKLATVSPFHFIGEMAFLKYSLVTDVDDSEDNDGSDHLAATCTATADAIVESGGATAWVWSFSDLRCHLDSDREVSNALSAYISHDLCNKLRKKDVSMTYSGITVKKRQAIPNASSRKESAEEAPREDVEGRT